jgi:cell division protein FtsZ
MTPSSSPVKIFGLGTAGIAVLDRLISPSHATAYTLPSPQFIAIDTDSTILASSSVPTKLHLENKLLRGLGSGGDPERAQSVAEECSAQIKTLCEGAPVIFIVAGLGGGSGTGIAPVLAEVARETGALVIAFVSLPFDCEGRRRQTLAQHGLEHLQQAADAVITLPNQKVFKLIDENTTVRDTFRITNDLLSEGIRGVWRLLAYKGLIEVQLADFCSLLRGRHSESSFATAEASGPTRSRDVLEKLLAHPMLDRGELLADSAAVLVSLISGHDLSMAEVNRVMEQIQRHCEHTQVLMGAAIDESFGDKLAVTVVVSRKEEQEIAVAETSRSATSEELDTQLLTRTATARPGSRFVPPPPALPPEKMQEMLKHQTAASRARKKQNKMRQGQLPLEIISKGRFDKSEPTIHRGEDLDVPTYIRRGISLN